LLVMDGIIEWRHEWEDPRMGARDGASYYQPVTADKIACLGRQTARLLESWGNYGKCEVVGAPRFDDLVTNPLPPAPATGKRVLLVMTANTPGFTPAQLRCVEQALASVASTLDYSSWDVIWRIKPELKQMLHLEDTVSGLGKVPLRAVLEKSHAVITTPSTAQLESMLSGRPTALLDFTNSPHYVSAAWSITAPEHISPVLAALSSPPGNRLLYQDYLLHDALECNTPASIRMVRLICKMVEAGIAARMTGCPIRFEPNILCASEEMPISRHYDLSTLYPGNPVLKNRDRDDLQRQLIFARQEIRILRAALRMRHFLKRAVGRITGAVIHLFS
jgi:hypothetical protein